MPLTTRVLDAVAQPMIYVTTRSSMLPREIGAVMERSFAILGRFMVEVGVVPLAPPLAVYRDWQGQKITIDVGFPVTPEDASKAKGEVLSGKTPAGPAIKTVHRGSYDKLKDTYVQLEKAMQAEGYRGRDMSWEVYYGEPGKTPEQDLVTEIYMQLAEAEAARATA
jgi:effector-binding domain-containing protein